ncbi:MAG: MaoC family dehydratase [bacterium]
MSGGHETIAVGEAITGAPLEVTRQTIADFAEASLDFNPLHFDEGYMEGHFGKTQFGGVIAHGMSTFALITTMMTDWLYPKGGRHRRLETKWLKPVRPGDTISPQATVTRKIDSENSHWVVFAVEVKNQKGELVATGEAMAEFP